MFSCCFECGEKADSKNPKVKKTKNGKIMVIYVQSVAVINKYLLNKNKEK